MRILNKIIGIIIVGIAFYSCEINDSAEGTLSPYIDIQDLKSLHKGDDLLLTKTNMKAGAHLIRGVVISDGTDKNREINTIVIQGTSKNLLRGIALELDESLINQYSFGDSLLIDVDNKYLKKVNGKLRITGIVPNNITVLKTGLNVVPQELNLRILSDNFEDYEYTLVKFYSLILDEDNKIDDDLFGYTNYKIDNIPLTIFFQDDADIVDYGLPWSASFVGVVRIDNNTLGWTIWPRSSNDISEASGPIYINFPENFEDKTLISYRATSEYSVNGLRTGDWGFFNSILGTSSNDRMNPSGLQSVRSQRNAETDSYVAMRFDLIDGASKVSFLYGSTAEDPGCFYRLEFSQDSGTTWSSITDDPVFINNQDARTATYMVNIVGKVRFRVRKITMGKNVIINNGRMNVDDFTVFKAF